MNSPFHADMQDALVRMVVPMRREFGCVLDVPLMRRDRGYAESIVAQALTSQVQSLRDCARRVAHHLSAAGSLQQAQRDATEQKTPAPVGVHHDAALAARLLIDLIGPMGEALAIRIERAPDGPALASLIGDARSRIADVRGEAVAADYARQTTRSGVKQGTAKPTRTDAAELRRAARRAACELEALLGPLGDELAKRMEHSADASALTALVAEAHDDISSVIGAAAADDYVERVMPHRG